MPLVLGSTSAETINYRKKLSSGKFCHVVLGDTYWHAGGGTDANRAVAEAEARRRWSRFVVLEYGRKYGNWAAADKHSMTCLNDTQAGVWRCRAEAQPCKG